MLLQIALDRIPLEQAVAVTRGVARDADWIEVGTSLVKRYGMEAVRAVVAAAGDTPVLSDTKTADDARTEVEMCLEAGARAITVLGTTTAATVTTCVELAEERGFDLLVDLLAVGDDRRDALVAKHGASERVVWAPHIGKDAQDPATSVTAALGPWARGRRLAIAGGLTARDVAALAPDWPDLRVIVGSAVTKADDPVAAVAELRSAAAS